MSPIFDIQLDKYDPRMKSMAVFKGVYPPGTPNVYINGSNYSTQFLAWQVQALRDRQASM